MSRRLYRRAAIAGALDVLALDIARQRDAAQRVRAAGAYPKDGA